jgi:pimeloyl-ACP methyl ester carboxylesterase
MGVRTALALTRKEPEKVAGVTAIDIGLTSDWGGGIGVPLANFLQNLPETFSSRPELRSHLFTHCPDPAIAQYLAAVSQKTSETPEIWGFPFDHEALVKTIYQAHQAPLKDWLFECLGKGVPFEFLRGSNSRVWLKEDYETQKQTLQHPLLKFEEWENCGHGLPFEQRNRFIDHLKSRLVSANF